MSYVATTHEWGLGLKSGRSAFTKGSTPFATFSSTSTGITLSVLSASAFGLSILSGSAFGTSIGISGGLSALSTTVLSAGVSGSLVSTVTDCSTVSVIGFSVVGVTGSALGGVRLKKELSTPTGGGRPRGRRRLSDALARFSTRQSDIVFELLYLTQFPIGLVMVFV